MAGDALSGAAKTQGVMCMSNKLEMNEV